SGVPRDLEVICLKCLNKAPAGRYGSARELADDLRRFRDGDPIRARPVGPVKRAARWVSRRPYQAALILVTLAGALPALAWAVTTAYYNATLQEEKAGAELARDEEKKARQAEAQARRQAEQANTQLEQANQRQAFRTHARQVALAHLNLNEGEYGL